MSTLGDAYIRIRPDTRGFAGEASRTVGGAMKSIAKAGAVAIAAGVGGATVALYGMAKAAAKDQQAAALLSKALKNNAGATDSQVASTERWITAQGKAFGVTDDDLRPALSKLVTATHDVGDAQKLASLAMDVSAGTGKDLSAVSTALMKAQNGQVSSLSRLGINTKNAAGETITMEQATKRMADTFGGAAKTKAQTLQGQMDRLKVVMSEAGESIGAKLIPVLTRMAGWVATKVVPAVLRFGGFIQSRVIPAVREFASQIQARVLPVALRFAAFFKSRVVPAVKEFATQVITKVLPAAVRFGSLIASKLKPVLDQIADTVRNQIIPTWQSWLPTIVAVAQKIGLIVAGATVFAAAIAGKVLPPIIAFAGWLVTFKPLVIGVVAAFVAWKTVTLAMAVAAAAQAAITGFWTAAIVANIAVSKAAAVAAKVWAAGQWLLNAALTANPIGLVVVAIAALVVGFIIAYKKSEAFRNIVNAAFTAVKNVVGGVVGWFAKYIPQVFAAVVAAVRVYVNIYKTIVVTAFKVVKAIVQGIINATKAVIMAVWRVIVAVVKGYVNAYKTVVLTAFKVVKAGIQSAMNAAKAVVSAIWRGIVTIIKNGATAIVNAVKAIPGKLKALGSLFSAAGHFIIEAFVNGLKNAAGIIGGIASSVWTALRSLLNGAISKINAALDFTISLPGPDIHVNAPNIPYLAGGARVTRPTLAMIGDGREPETVMNDTMLTKALAMAAGGRGGDGALVQIDTVNTYDVNAAARAITAEQRKALIIASFA